VLAGLTALRGEFDKLEEQSERLHTQAVELIARGRAARVPVTAMAEAFEVHRQMLHAIIRNEVEPLERSRSRKGGGRNA
jgi:hypothetical protein